MDIDPEVTDRACLDRWADTDPRTQVHRPGLAGGFGLVDFDKAMFAEPVDLAKLIATGLFRTRGSVRFQVRGTAELLEGYESVRPLSDVELVALEGLAVLLNEHTAYLGDMHDVEEYRRDAEAVASWWVTRRRNAPTTRSVYARPGMPRLAPTRRTYRRRCGPSLPTVE